MASGKTISLFAIIILVVSLGEACSQETPMPVDSIKADSLDVIDSTALVDTITANRLDSVKFMAIRADSFSFVPDTSISQYYKSFITGRSYGDYFWYKPGVLPLQHGADGHPEMLVKSLLLGGSDVLYNGTPVFQQGYYIPFKTGADLDAFMYENVAEFGLTPVHSLDLFSQGENLGLVGAVWTPSDNPSSITVAGGPYGYHRSAWRFTRRFSENLSGNLIIGFKKGASYYQSGGGYKSYGVSGAFAAKPKPNIEIAYTFYDHKADEGLIQFDRIIEPYLKLKRQVNFHQVSGRYIFDKEKKLAIKSYYQANHNFIVDDARTHSSRLKDYLSGTQAEYSVSNEDNNYKLSAGASYQRLGGVNSDDSKMTTLALTASDSISIDSINYLLATIRARYNSIGSFNPAGTIAYSRQLNSIGKLTISSGYYDYMPDIYSRYYNIIVPYTISSGTIGNFYSYSPDDNLKSKNSVFVSAEYVYNPGQRFNIGIGLTLERVFDDILQVTSESSFTYSTRPINISYNRATITGKIEYYLTKYYLGSSGISLFLYDPSEPRAGMKHSPKALAYTNGRIQLRNVLRDVDLAAAFQAHYVSAREYAGLVQTSYKNAANLDASLVFRFGAIEFKIIETNVLDFIGGNNYSIWGEYLMPPGNVWWQLTWDFNN
jgi:hypothetical protein